MHEQEDQKTILLVEDEALIAIMEKETLKQQGFNVIIASSGEKAIAVVQNVPHIDLILMDINLGKGKMDGTEAAETILRTHDIPVLFLSSYTQADVVEKTERITSFGYVVKDSGETVLLASIKMAFKLHAAYLKLKEREEVMRESEEKFHLLFEKSVDPMLMLNGDRFVDCNEAAVKIIHCSRKDQLIGLRPSDVSPERQPDGRLSSEKADELISIALKQGSNHFEWKHRTLDGDEFWADVSLTVIPIQRMRILHVLWRDVSERIEARQKAIEWEQSLYGILSASPNGIGKMQNRVFEWVNYAVCRITGYTFDELKGASSRMLYRTHEEYERTGELLYRTGRADTILVTKEGAIRNVLIQVSPTTSYSYIFTFTDITDRVQAEKEGEALERRLFQLIDFLPDPTFAIDSEKRIVVWNRAMENLTGISAADMMGKGDYAYTIPFYGVARPQLMDLFWIPDHKVAERYPLIQKEGGNYVIEVFCPALFNGKGAHVWAKAAPLLDADGRLAGAIEVIRDMTRYRQAEEAIRKSEEKYRSIFESVVEGIFQTTQEGRFLTVNPSLAGIYGYSSPEEMMAMTTDIGRQVYVNPGERDEFLRIIQEEGIVTNFELQMRRKDGSTFWASLNSRPVYDENGTLLYYEGTSEDITVRRQAEEQIKSLLADKELLLREVHHRIKNNMNVIGSLLSLHARTLKDPSAVSALKDSENRVRSMMVLYDKLYRSKDFRAILTKEYLTSLIEEIVKNFPNRGLVTIATEIDDFLLDAKTLSPIGIILNELLTNAMKHAFIGRQSGKIEVSLSLHERYARLTVHDNGTGIPESIDIAASPGFGLHLVSILVEQIEGTIRLERQGGTQFVLEFETSMGKGIDE